jgi:hypothetical protein
MAWDVNETRRNSPVSHLGAGFQGFVVVESGFVFLLGSAASVSLPAGVLGFFAALFFFAGVFFAGSVSSTITFFGGAASTAACMLRIWVRSCPSSPYLVLARVSTRSANDLRARSTPSKSLLKDWNSSLFPKAPADSTTEPNTS